MALHACIEGTIVVDLIDIFNDSQYLELASKYSAVIDLTPIVLKPLIGWELRGVSFYPPENQQVDLSKLVGDRILYYQSLAPEILKNMYVENTLNGITAQQSSDMFTEYGEILLCIKEGAWPTAIYKLSQKQPSGFVTQQMIDNWISLLQSKMV